VSPAYVQDQLVHKSIDLTVGTYGRWLRKRAPGAVNGLDDAQERIVRIKRVSVRPYLAFRQRREEKWYGTAGVPGYFRKPFGGGWALVGDASYNRDPITAQGISDAFIDRRDARGSLRLGSLKPRFACVDVRAGSSETPPERA
jgi:2-polyprenyl-6-methoxyphenol hydroxylase-like FAD-dependent oxidoreductase